MASGGDRTEAKFPHKASEDPSSEVAMSSVVLNHISTMAMNAVCKLEIPDIIYDKAGDAGQISLEEIVAELKCKSPANAIYQLRRVLTVLVQQGLFTESVVESESGQLRSVYGLTRISALFRTRITVLNGYFGLRWSLHPVFIGAMKNLDALILDPEVTPIKAFLGQDLWDAAKEDPGLAQTFQDCMTTTSKEHLASLLVHYQGFEGIKTLVDVGGGLGMTISEIVSVHPHIHGICFDLPNVVASATPVPGVEFVGGDMFESIPNGGDAIIVKRILHDWDDEHCLMILKNCRESLQPNGKVIVIEGILGDPKDDSFRGKLRYTMDILMMATCAGGKERTYHEWKSLTAAAGFSKFEVVPMHNCFLDIFELRL